MKIAKNNSIRRSSGHDPRGLDGLPGLQMCQNRRQQPFARWL